MLRARTGVPKIGAWVLNLVGVYIFVEKMTQCAELSDRGMRSAILTSLKGCTDHVSRAGPGGVGRGAEFALFLVAPV